MKYTVIVEPRAIKDIQDAIDYYNELKEGLGGDFYKALNNHIHVLEENPFFQVFYKNYRGLTIKGFPYYQIIFYINENKKLVLIDAVFHSSQNTDKKPK